MPASARKPSAKTSIGLTGGHLGLGIVLVSLVAACGVTYLLYGAVQRVFRVAIDERLQTMASIASLQFAPDELAGITGPESIQSAAYERAVRSLQRIRQQTGNIRFAYILRRTPDPDTLAFVADADSLHPDVPYDLNGDGVINDEDALTFPGDPYDISEFPEFQEAVFERVFVDPDFTASQWGVFLAGTAPIRDPATATKPTDYAIGLDLDVTQYQIMLRQVLLPFLGFVIFLLFVIGFQALSLRGLWKRQVRQLAEIDRQKDELIGIVAHQLGGPITAIRWSLEEISDGDFGTLTDAGREAVKATLAATLGLSDITCLLLDVSRIELGRLRMNKSEVKINDFIADVVHVVEPRAWEKKVHLDFDISPDLGSGFLDLRLTHMTLENLLSNAIKYTPPGGTVRLTIRVNNGVLRCTVSDTGIGIPLADQPRLFEKLFRASNVGSIDGNGFGLYVAKGAIEQQGGTLRFESAEGKGTTFHVELPVTPTD